MDVGGRRKNFDVAVINERGVVAGPLRLPDPAAVVDWLRDSSPRVVAVDSPRVAAPPGASSRECERWLARAVCGIRFTPHLAALRSHARGYYDWVLNGLELYRALDSEPRWEVIECFPTATWTRLGGSRRSVSRAQWSREVLEEVGMGGLPARMGQDARDAIGAALTARLYDRDETEAFGEIVVPRSRAQTRGSNVRAIRP